MIETSTAQLLLRVKLFCVALVTLTMTYAQNEDELHQKIFRVHSDETRLLDELYYAHQSDNRPDMDSLFSLVEKFDIENWSTDDSLAYFFARAGYLYHSEKIDVALEDLFLASMIARKKNDEKVEAALQHQIGNCYYYLRDYYSALDAYYKVLSFDSALMQSKASVHHNIAAICYEFYMTDDNPQKKDSLTNVINLHYSKSIVILKVLKNEKHLAATYSVLIPWYVELNQIDSAYACADRGMAIADKYGLESRKAFLRINIGHALAHDGRYQEAFDTLESTMEYFVRNKNSSEQMHTKGVQASVYAMSGDYKKAYELKGETMAIQRKMFIDKLSKSVGDYRAKYQTNVKELENQELLIENKTKQLKLNRLVLLALSLAAFGFGVFFFYRNRLKKNRLEMQEQEIKFKNKLIQSNMESEEKERKRIARELHDGVGQQISSIKLGLENMSDNQEKTSMSINELKAMVVDVLHNVRGISHQMMPVALQRFGLVKAINSLTDFMNDNGVILYVFENLNIENLVLDETTEIHLYRIVQELATNINKHSNASQATIQIFKQMNCLMISVSDNGVGMPIENKNVGMGLLNIHSRVSAIEGTLSIESIGGETVVQIKMPLVESAKAYG